LMSMALMFKGVLRADVVLHEDLQSLLHVTRRHFQGVRFRINYLFTPHNMRRRIRNAGKRGDNFG